MIIDTLPLRPQRILALVDTRALFARSEAHRCLDRIARLAMEYGCSVTLCDVLEPPPDEDRGTGVVQRLHELRVNFARDSLERLAEPVRDLIPISVAVWSGTSFLVVIRQVQEAHYDLVVHVTMGSADGGHLGANDMHLARKCPCPVWVMDAEREEAYRHIVVAVDRDIFANTEHASTFAMQLSQTALMFGRLERSRVTMVHAWEPFGAELLDDHAAGSTRRPRSATSPSSATTTPAGWPTCATQSSTPAGAATGSCRSVRSSSRVRRPPR